MRKMYKPKFNSNVTTIHIQNDEARIKSDLNVSILNKKMIIVSHRCWKIISLQLIIDYEFNKKLGLI